MLLSQYNELLKDVRWLTKRKKVLNRDDFMCQYCSVTGCRLQVHHITRGPKGSNAAPWECSNDCLITLCVPCHQRETFYGNDAQRYLWKVVLKKGIEPATVRSLTKAVKELYNVKNGAELRLVSRVREHSAEKTSTNEIIRSIIDLINTIGRRFPSHPFINLLVRTIEGLPNTKPQEHLEFLFEDGTRSLL